MIGDIVNGLFVDYMFLIEKFKGKNEYKNWFDVLIFFFYNNMIIYISRRDVNKVWRKFGIISSDGVYFGYLYFFMNDLF